MRENFDVAIVGGGPAGSTCAWKLQQAGARVVVIDSKTFPRDKVCAGWVTPPIWKTLEVDPDEYQDGRVLEPITGFRTGIIGGHEIETRYDRVVSYGIVRREFDNFLLARCGAELRTGQSVHALTRVENGWHINGEYFARFLVGAGGNFCPVARLLKASEAPRSHLVTAQEIEFPIAADTQTTIMAGFPELFFCDDFAGYGWCCRKGPFLNVGLGRVEEDHLADHVATFVQFLRDRGKLLSALPGRFHGHAYQLYSGSPKQLAGDRVLLIGDSAGLAHPRSGEGIRPAVESGIIAAKAITNLGTQDPELLALEYTDRITSHFSRVTNSFSVSQKLPAAYVWGIRKLLESNLFTRHIVLDRWFLGSIETPIDHLFS